MCKLRLESQFLESLAFVSGLTGLKNQLTLGDVAFMSEELYGGRSILSGIPRSLFLLKGRS